MEAFGDGRLPTRLLAAPPSLPNESRLSWVQRLCGAHQYTFGCLSVIAGIPSSVGDWDIGVPQSEWLALLRLAEMKADSCGEAIYSLDLFSARFTQLEILFYEKKLPRYRWCSHCLSSDPVPYLRWEWRLLGVYHCSIHQVPLDDRCAWCGSTLLAHRALLVSSGDYAGAPDLATCAKCGMSLFDRGDCTYDEHQLDDPFDGSLAVVEFLAFIKQCYQSDERPVKLNFSRYEDYIRHTVRPDSSNYSRATDQQVRSSFDPLIGKLSNPNNWSLKINGTVFRDDVPLALKSAGSSNIGSDIFYLRRRLRLAHAIQIIRTEKYAQRDLVEAESAGGLA